MKLTLSMLCLSLLVTACGSREKKQEAAPAPAAAQVKELKPAEVQKYTASWSQEHKDLVNQLTGKYGQPTEGTSNMIIWRGNEPWKQTTVHKENSKEKMLEQTANLRVPPEKIGDVALFNKQVVVNATANEVSSRSNREELNILALNLTDEIVNKGMSPMEARRQYSSMSSALKRSNDYTKRLRLPSNSSTENQ
jgi:hypothetical protein